jgi:hypothetical protein
MQADTIRSDLEEAENSHDTLLLELWNAREHLDTLLAAIDNGHF